MKPSPVTWEFGDLGARVAINVLEVEMNKKIVWESTALGQPASTFHCLATVALPRARVRETGSNLP